MKKGFGILAIIATVSTPLAAQTASMRDKWADSARVLIETAVRHGSMNGVDSARTIIERVMTAFPEDPVLLHYDGYALYRKATIAMARDPKADTGPFLDKAREQLEKSSKKLALPETFALQSSVLGQIIARSRNPITAMTLGMKSTEAMNRAVDEGGKNPRVWLLRGIGAIFTPSMWGGGLDKAAQHLEKSVSYFATDNPRKPLPAWGRAEAYIWLGQVYSKQGKTDAARGAYESAVKLEPDNGWAQALLNGRAQPVAER